MRLAEELRQAGHTVEIRTGWIARFVVTADGAVVFSRRTERRLPMPGEVSERLHAMEGI